MLPLRAAELATEIEEIVLNVGQDIANIDIAYMQHRDADDRVRLVDAAIGCHAHVELWQTRSIAERRTAVVAGECKIRSSFMEVFRCSRVGLLDPAAENLLKHKVARKRFEAATASQHNLPFILTVEFAAGTMIAMVPFGDQKGTR